MPDFPCFDSEISASGLKFTIHTELVPSGAFFKISTFVSSSGRAEFSFNSGPEENFSAEDLRAQHERITGKVSLIFPPEENAGSENNVDFAALYMKKEFHKGNAAESKQAESIKKILVFKDE